MSGKSVMNQISFGIVDIPYTIKYTNIKGVSIQFNPDKTLTIRANRQFSLSQIESFIREKESWIIKQYNKKRNIILPNKDEVLLFGKPYQVIARLNNKNFIEQTSDEVIVYSKKELSEPQLILALEKYRLQLLKQYVESLRPMVENVTKVVGVEYHYRTMSSRFGSCIPKKKKITLNTHLVSLSTDQIQNVIFHEYAHFYHMNHSKKFYETLAQFYPDYKIAEKKLKSVVLKQ